MTNRNRLVNSDPYVRRRRWGIPILGISVLVVAGLSLSLGAVDVAGEQVAAVLAGRLGLDWFGEAGPQAVAVVWGIRMPRLLMGLVVGAALAATGSVLQGMLRSDLADPQLLGIGPGAAIGAAIGSGAGGVQGAIAGGVAAGVVTSFVVRRLYRQASIDQTRLILSGVALGATLSAWVGFVVFASNRSVVPPIEFWLLGGLAGSTWRAVGTATVFLFVAVGVLIAVSRTIDLLAVGPREAWHLGVDVDLTMTILFIVVGAAVGASVGAIGVVVFVGLLVPFLMRRLAGPIHRHLIPTAMLGGGLFLISADLVARLLIEPVELPVGLITAAIGGPLFLWLVSRKRDV
ncbi:MAG TPA: iron ABC transporter permease [Acidimicrobiia bacterium]